MLFTSHLFRSELLPLKSSPVYQDLYSRFWLEGDLVYIVLEQKVLTQRDIEIQLKKFARFLRGKQYCAIMDFSKVSPSVEIRNYLVARIPELFNAVAFLSCHDKASCETVAAKPSNSHAKAFKSELDALCWVNQFLAN